MQHIWNGCEFIMHFSPFLPIIGALVKVLNPVWNVDEQTICFQDTAHRLPISFFLSFSFISPSPFYYPYFLLLSSITPQIHLPSFFPSTLIHSSPSTLSLPPLTSHTPFPFPVHFPLPLSLPLPPPPISSSFPLPIPPPSPSHLRLSTSSS